MLMTTYRRACIVPVLLTLGLPATTLAQVPALHFELDDLTAVLPGQTLFEDFENYPVQTNTAASLGDSIFVTGASGGQVASVSWGLASATGIGDNAGDGFWFVETGTGVQEDDGFLATGRLPGFGAGPYLGDFGTLAGGKDLSAATLFSVDARETTGGTPARIAFVLIDGNDVEWTTSSSPLSSTFVTYTATLADFGPFPGVGGVLDTTNITQVSLDVLGPVLTPWSDQGCALAGVSGDPLLMGNGPLADGSSNSVDLDNANQSALAGLFLALSSTPVPFKGGTLKPVPFFTPVFLSTSATGTISIPFVMPSGVPSGTELWVQWGIQDAAAVSGVALSNAIKGVTP